MTMSEATTYGGTVAALQKLDQQAQGCQHEAGRVARTVEQMAGSQQALDQALTGFKLDRRTLAASQRLQEATAARKTLTDDAVAAGARVSEATQAALESVGQHRQLAQAVQEHGEAAHMPWYRNGR